MGKRGRSPVGQGAGTWVIAVPEREGVGDCCTGGAGLDFEAFGKILRLRNRTTTGAGWWNIIA